MTACLHRPWRAPGLALALALAGGDAQAQAFDDAGLAAVARLGQINGQALACQDSAAARRAKALMLAHAPKTARFGQAFDDSTQQAFLATTGGQRACSDAVARSQQLDAAGRNLQAVLPATGAR